MIVEEGFDGFSMKKLAKAANISPSTIYIYFLNKEDLISNLFAEIAEEQAEAILKDFSSEMDFAPGLLIQWQNRYKYAIQHPIRYRFFEQFCHSPLIMKVEHEVSKEFKTTMTLFFANQESKVIIPDLPSEMVWALIFGPLYSIINFSLVEDRPNKKQLSVTDENLKVAFETMITPFLKGKAND